MKTQNRFWKLLPLLLAPLFINALCNKEDDETPKPDEYISWSFTGTTGQLSKPADSLVISRQGNTTIILGGTRTGPSNSFTLFFDSPASPGNYSSSSCSLMLSSNDYNQTTSPVAISVTNYGTSGGYVTGTYSGTLYKSSNNAPISVTGEFRLKNQ